MIDSEALLANLQQLLKQLENDIRRRCVSQPEVDAPLRDQYAAAKEANRTAQAYEVWRDDQITQATVAWILGCVFVRFCEDNLLVDPPRLSGPGDRRKRAEDEHTLYFQQYPTHSDREYLQWVFEQAARLPALKELFDKRHNPLWSLGVSGDGAMLLREFWHRRDPATGKVVHDFAHPAFVPAAEVPVELEKEAEQEPTRFLGDLYQDLSESARKKYALLQTPVFVEEFILDRTLEPAIREFGFQQVRMIDPTCGSGHFLLGGFRRMFDLWMRHEPATNVRELAQRALNQVYGVDLNPYAVAIARFRLLVAVLRACDIRRLEVGKTPAFTMHLAAGDSLLHGPRPDLIVGRQEYLLGEDPLAYVYDTEDAPLLRKYLGQQYHVVVGNPPYITPKDKALNDAYRDRFKSSHRQYSLAVPFFERFFDLAQNGDSPGFVGMITANSFMKREFGKKLIEQYVPRWDVTHVIDTSGAYIPGHGTPTVILFGRNRRPVSSTIRTVMGIRGEPSTPADAALGQVWSAVLDQVDRPGSQSDFVSVADTDRQNFHRHPWSIGGGGASELKVLIDESGEKMMSAVEADIGIASWAGIDEVCAGSEATASRLRWEPKSLRPFVTGEVLRDWTLLADEVVAAPYDDRGMLFSPSEIPACVRFWWRFRRVLQERVLIGGETFAEAGVPFYAWVRWQRDRYAAKARIVFAFISTHNHFVLDRGGKVFNRSAPIIKLPADATEDQHLGLLGLLNSSVACFWMKQVFMPKGGHGIGRGIQDEAWEGRLEFDGTKLDRFPLPDARPLAVARRLDESATDYNASLPAAVVRTGVPTADELDAAQRRTEHLRGQRIALQEELDWQCYGLYGLLADPPLADLESVPTIGHGQRAFEIVLARQVAVGDAQTTWFERHSSTPITDIPAHWPEDYKRVVRRRIDVIGSDQNIALIERPEYKRRWNTEPWNERQERALRSWLLDRLEGWPLEEGQEGNGERRSLMWDEQEPRLISVAQLADRVRQDMDLMQVAALYRDRDDFDVTKLVADLVEDETVPFLPVLRYKEPGLRNRRVWEQVWDLQRLEDAIDARTKLPPDDPQHLTEQQATAEKKAKVGDIPSPPKYKSTDMLNGTIWRLRGKLDVPKERFVSFPHCQREGDPTLVLTWAGFNHLQQMQALAAYYVEMKEQAGWSPERRVPLLAGMLELLPWVLQWHNDVDPVHQLRMGDYYREFIDDEAREIGKTLEQIRAWTPPAKAAGRGRKVKA